MTHRHWRLLVHTHVATRAEHDERLAAAADEAHPPHKLRGSKKRGAIKQRSRHRRGSQHLGLGAASHGQAARWDRISAISPFKSPIRLAERVAGALLPTTKPLSDCEMLCRS